MSAPKAPALREALKQLIDSHEQLLDAATDHGALKEGFEEDAKALADARDALPAPEGLDALAAARPLLREALKGVGLELSLRATIVLAEIDAQLRMALPPRPYKPTLRVLK